MRYLLVLLVALMVGCVPEPKPDYCYRLTGADHLETWYCEGRASFPADTLPDNLKDEQEPPVVLTPR